MEQFGLNPLPVQLPLDSSTVFCLLSDSIISNEKRVEPLSEQDWERINAAKSDLYERVATISERGANLFQGQIISRSNPNVTFKV